MDLGCPVHSDGSDLTLLKEQTLNDPSLKHCCRLADSKSMGYSWKKGLLVHKLDDPILGARERIILPKPRHPFILNAVHEQSGHFGARKVRSLLNYHFTWPGMQADVEDHVKLCDTCLRFNKAGNKAVQLLQRPLVSEPFESIAVHIVGLLPKAREELDSS